MSLANSLPLLPRPPPLADFPTTLHVEIKTSPSTYFFHREIPQQPQGYGVCEGKKGHRSCEELQEAGPRVERTPALFSQSAAIRAYCTLDTKTLILPLLRRLLLE